MDRGRITACDNSHSRYSVHTKILSEKSAHHSYYQIPVRSS